MEIPSGVLFGVWIPVAARLPGKAKGYWSEDVIVHNSSGHTRIDSYYNGDDRGFWNIHRGPTTATVTHWMPLPTRPNPKPAGSVQPSE